MGPANPPATAQAYKLARAHLAQVAEARRSRRNLHIDRLASAWLIKQFIDKRPRFYLKDDKFHRLEAAGLNALIDGLSNGNDRATATEAPGNHIQAQQMRIREYFALERNVSIASAPVFLPVKVFAAIVEEQYAS